MIFIDTECPRCGEMCGNSGAGAPRCKCGWAGEDPMPAIERMTRDRADLAAYRAPGLSPEEVAGLARTKEEGKLVFRTTVPYCYLGEEDMQPNDGEEEGASICVVRCTACGWRMFGDGWRPTPGGYHAEQIPRYCGHCGSKFAEEEATDATMNEHEPAKSDPDLPYLCDGYIRAENERIRLKQERQWIPCSERMPEPRKRVLGTWGALPMVGEVYITQNGEWRRPGANSYWDERVTHWMQLPGTPEEGESKC